MISWMTRERMAWLIGTAILSLSLAAPVLASGPVVCETDHVVQSGEWLARIAADQYGDWKLYPAIVWATNAQATDDASYATVSDPWLIQPDWKLCLPGAETARAMLAVSALQNAEYGTDWTPSGHVSLVNGYYEEAAAPGSASKIVVQLGERMAFGYTADGKALAMVTLVSSGGGSGTFYELAAVLDEDGSPVNTARVLLGDRIQIKALAIQAGETVIDMVTQGPDDPMCCPTQRVLRHYALQADGLKLVSERIISAE